jgi:hypothetical protein
MSAGMVLQHHVPLSAICRYLVVVPENQTTLAATDTTLMPIVKLKPELTIVTVEIIGSGQIRKIGGGGMSRISHRSEFVDVQLQ